MQLFCYDLSGVCKIYFFGIVSISLVSSEFEFIKKLTSNQGVWFNWFIMLDIQSRIIFHNIWNIQFKLIFWVKCTFANSMIISL